MKLSKLALSLIAISGTGYASFSMAAGGIEVLRVIDENQTGAATSCLIMNQGMDNPDNPTSVVLSDEQLLEYLDHVEKKTLSYLDSLTDDMLYEHPENCRFTRMELVLRQFRHLPFHTGMLNGQTALSTGSFPVWVSDADKFIDDGIFFGRYRAGQTKI